jgi:hypothetical protein
MKMSAKQANIKDWFRLNELVWDHPFENESGISANKQKLLMLALVKFADGDGKSCYPGQTRLAVMAGQSPRSVKRGLKLFGEQGFVESKRRWHTSNAYTINEETLREATVMAYLSVAFVLATNGRLTPALSGHIERIFRPCDTERGAKEELQSGHDYGLRTTSLDLPKVELPVADLTDSIANSFAFASHRAKSDQNLDAQPRANPDWLTEEDCAPCASSEAPDDPDLVQAEIENQFFDKADSVAFPLAATGASVQDILGELKLLLSRSDPRLEAAVPECELESIAQLAVERRGPKPGRFLNMAA